MSKIYGIDLGTTTSSIGYDGSILVPEGVISSEVDLDRYALKTTALYSKTGYRNYKVNMSTDPSGEKPIKASSIVLRELKDKYMADSNKAVITVPAYFTTAQRRAVKKAAELAGVNVMHIINEPTAATFAISMESEVTLVYDLGGGTFDVTLLEGSKVITTTGLVLGGKDLDNELYRVVLAKLHVPVIKQDDEFVYQLENEVIRAKHRMCITKTDEVITIGDKSCILKYQELVDCTNNVFAATYDLLTSILVTHADKYLTCTIVLIGGTCNNTVIYDSVKEIADMYGVQVFLPSSHKLDKLVTEGASIFAKRLEEGYEIDELLEDVTNQIVIKSDDNKPIVVIPKDTLLPCEVHVPLSVKYDDKPIRLRFYQTESYVIPEDSKICEIIVPFNKLKANDLLDLSLSLAHDGTGVLSVHNIFTDEIVKEAISF